MFTFEDAQEAQSTFKPTIDPGIHKVIILGHELKTPEDASKSPYSLVRFSNIEGTREAVIKFYTNDAVKAGSTKSALDISLGNAKHIATHCKLTENDKAKVKGASKLELLSSMLNACLGKPYKQKFCGEEYLDESGNVKVRIKIGFPNFAEDVDVPDNESKLLFKMTDQYDYKRLPKMERPEEIHNFPMDFTKPENTEHPF